MKLLALTLALAMATPAFATQSHAAPGANMKEFWRASIHRELVYCAGFYAVSINFFKDVKPEASRDAKDLKNGAIYFVAQLKVPEAESSRHLNMFQAELKRDYNYAGAYPKLFEAYAKKCDGVMNSFPGQYAKHYGIPK